MIDPTNVPEITAEEQLARYVLYNKYVRASNQTVKPEAFVPHPSQELSVTRHLMATEQDLWAVGTLVASTQRKTLYGRADITAQMCMAHNLAVKKAPIATNPNHAHVTNWPADKPLQKMIAIELAAIASYHPKI